MNLEKTIIFVLLLLCFGDKVQSHIYPIDKVQKQILEIINETAGSFGDMIEIKRHGYFHWSVYVHDGTVIQLNNPEFDKLTIENVFENFTGEVELRDLIQLAGEDHCRINNKISESKRKGLQFLSDSEILKKMKVELQHRDTYYNIVTYNCEHFAAKLKFGTPFSSQIEAAKKIALQSKEFRETVAEMFKIAVKPNPTDSRAIN